MSTAAVKWTLDAMTVQSIGSRKAQRGRAVGAEAPDRVPVVGDAAFARTEERSGGAVARRALARAESALFALTLGSVAYLWLVLAMGSF